VNWVQLTQNQAQWWDRANKVVNLRIPKEEQNPLSRGAYYELIEENSVSRS
jgi:hypothetical protein